MGWTSYQATCYKNGRVDRLAECRKEFKNGFHFPILKDAMRGTTYYAAMRNPEGKVFPLIVLTSVKNGEFSYKDMEGSMGPFYYDCPESILKLVTIKDESTKEWVEKCREHQKKKRTLQNLLNEAKEKHLTLKVTLPFTLSYSDYFEIPEGKTVYVKYWDKNRFRLENEFYAIRQKTLRKIGINNISIVNE